MAAGASRGTLERSESLDVVRIREEVEKVERGETPAERGQPGRVARKSYRIAGQEANDVAGLRRDGVDDIAPRAGARRIEKDKVRLRNRVVFHRRVNEMNVLRRVAFRVFEGEARA